MPSKRVLSPCLDVSESRPAGSVDLLIRCGGRDLRARVDAVVMVLTVLTGLLPAAASAQWLQIGQDLDGEAAADGAGYSVAISSDGSRLAVGAPFNDGGGSDSGHVRVYQWNGATESWVQRGQDIDGEAPEDACGVSVALSADGSRVAIGATGNDANGNSSGHVRVFQYNGFPINDWLQVGQDIDGEAPSDVSGASVALSADGATLAVGAPRNDNAGGVDAGHVRVFTWYNSSWIRRGSDIDGEAGGDESGGDVALSADGTWVAIGARHANSDNSGHVRVYGYQGFPISNWIQVGADIDGEAPDDESGWSVAVSADGTRLAVGAPQNDGGAFDSGHVRVFEWQSPDWVQLGSDIDGQSTYDGSGWSVSLSADGSRLAVGEPYNDAGHMLAGQVRVHRWSNSNWVQLGSDIEGSENRDAFGWAVSLSSDGLRLVIGVPSSDSGGLVERGLTRVYSGPIFVDGFESGDTLAWSATTPDR